MDSLQDIVGNLVGSASAPGRLEAGRVLTQLLEAEKSITCGQESGQTYLATHKARFADILRLCQRQVPDASVRVLDIGRSELTAYLGTFYKNIQTLGLDPSLDDGGHRELTPMAEVPHITFDLLNSAEVSDWPVCGSFDLIVFSEVIEHLCVAPEFVFAVLRFLLSERGVLICTTPNAADISKRLLLMAGRNPYERLRLYATNPGHVREYTKRELRKIAYDVGLRLVDHYYFHWIPGGGQSIKRIIARLLRVWPSFRSFQICVLIKDEK